MKLLWKIIVSGTLAILGFLLITSAALDYPSTFSSDSSKYYLDNLSITGAINLVSAILLDFRAYDTLGEVLIIYVTIAGILLLIERKR
ncbi:MAG: hypothetical protein KKG04_07500 [Candidatus Thermoplasmatota archaeon]|nr:hypothetical protein [Candidatus Thermoplasmatota archaeon]